MEYLYKRRILSLGTDFFISQIAAYKKKKKENPQNILHHMTAPISAEI